MPKGVVLLSGGLDSTTLLAQALHDGFAVHAMTFRYGQRHASEIDAAKRVARRYAVRDHVIVDIDLRTFGGSALTADIDIPKDRDLRAVDRDGIPITYVPARNTIFLSFALAWAEVLGAGDIFVGVNALDYSGYPDCRPEYIAAYERMANLATRRAVEGEPVRIAAPIVHMGKADIVRRGTELGVDFSLTVSCYSADGDGRACGRCDACRLRREGFIAAGVPDPTRYQAAPR